MLNKIEQAAISKAASLPKELPAGVHNVDMLIRIVGTITKGEDYNSVIYQSIPFDQLFTIAMSKLNGVTIKAVVKEALAQDFDTTNVKEEVKEAVIALTEKSVKTCSGKTTAKLAVEKIGEATLA